MALAGVVTFSSAEITAFSRSSLLGNVCSSGSACASPAMGRDWISSASASSAPALSSRELRQAASPQARAPPSTTAAAAVSTVRRCPTIQPMARPAMTWNSSGRFSCLRSILSANDGLLQNASFSRNSVVKSIAM